MIPDGIVSTGWPAVERVCREFGDEFDEWQRGLGRVILGRRADGIYAATVGGVTLSIPRQVAKTFLVGRIVFALCVLFPGLRVVWTAHRTRTATNTFRSMQAYARRPKVAAVVADIRRVNGEQEISFANGSIIMFGAREQGFGRGFDEIDVEVFDEAQILTEKALEDMVAATNQSRHPHGALLFFMGTPPRPVDPGEVFTQRRKAALAGEATDAIYVECSADPGADLDDQEQWRKANPSFPHRTPLRSMLRLRRNLPGDDSWRREGLGVWDEALDRPQPVIDPNRWAQLVVAAAPTDGPVGYGVKFSPDGLTVALAGGVRPPAGPIHVEGIEVRSMVDGTRWLLEFLLARRHTTVAIDGRAGAGALRDALVEGGFPRHRLIYVTAEQAVAAHAGFLTAVMDGAVSHIGDEAVAASVASAGRRRIGNAGGWGFETIDGGDVTLAESVVLAHFATARARTGRGAGVGREAVVL